MGGSGRGGGGDTATIVYQEINNPVRMGVLGKSRSRVNDRENKALKIGCLKVVRPDGGRKERAAPQTGERFQRRKEQWFPGIGGQLRQKFGSVVHYLKGKEDRS